MIVPFADCSAMLRRCFQFSDVPPAAWYKINPLWFKSSVAESKQCTQEVILTLKMVPYAPFFGKFVDEDLSLILAVAQKSNQIHMVDPLEQVHLSQHDQISYA